MLLVKGPLNPQMVACESMASSREATERLGRAETVMKAARFAVSTMARGDPRTTGLAVAGRAQQEISRLGSSVCSIYTTR